MTVILGLIVLLAPLAATFFVTRLTAPRNRVEAAVTYTTALSVCIVLLGYVLSAFSKLGDLGWWAAGGIVALVLTLLPAVTPQGRARLFAKITLPYEVDRRVRAAGWRRLDTWLLLLPFLTVVIVSAINFFLILSFEPATPDAHTYHLPRMLYFLQHGNLNYFPTDYWNIVAYPKIASLLHLFAYLTSGEVVSLVQLVQFVAYFVTMVALYGICRELGAPRRGSLFAALTFGLMVICIMEAATAQNDLILTAFIACTVYYLMTYRVTRRVWYLMLATVPLALALGVKATVLLALPATLVVIIFALWPVPGQPQWQWARHLGIGLVALVLALLIFTAPSGYVDNWRVFHDPFGPTILRKRDTMEGRSAFVQARDAGYNFLRYSVELLEPDGVPPLPGYQWLEKHVTDVSVALFNALHLKLESPIGSRVGYSYLYSRPTVTHESQPTVASENTSTWGPVGPLLVLPIALLALFGFVKGSPGVRWFAIAAVLYHLAAASLMLYDPFHGRFYTTAAVFALPPLAFVALQPRPWIGRLYLALAVLLVCVVGVNAALSRSGSSFYPMTYWGQTVSSVFGYGRTGQLVREAPTFLPATIEEEIPKDADIGLDVSTPFPEYFLFGDQHLRHVIALNPLWGQHLPPPPGVHYLIYDDRSPLYHPGDMAITDASYAFGAFYLRVLK